MSQLGGDSVVDLLGVYLSLVVIVVRGSLMPTTTAIANHTGSVAWHLRPPDIAMFPVSLGGTPQ